MHLTWIEYGNLILIVLSIHVAVDIYQEKKVETKQDKKSWGWGRKTRQMYLERVAKMWLVGGKVACIISLLIFSLEAGKLTHF